MSFKEECQKLFDHYVVCYRQGDAKGCASVFAEEAEMYSPFGPPSLGKQAIEETMQTCPKRWEHFKARAAIEQADRHFESLAVTGSTPIRRSGNRGFLK
jgi:ketosteroid isomerase-like protein